MHKINGTIGKRAVAMTLALLLLAGSYIYVCLQKQDFHTDEYYTYQLANSTLGPWWVVPQDEWFSPDYLQQQMAVQEGHQFDYASVIYHERYDFHPFLYTALIHTVCSFFPGQFNSWFGLGVNIAFALLCVWFLYLCMKRLTGGFWIPLLSSLFFGVSYGMVNEVVFTRMYVIAMFLVTLTVWLHLKCFDDPDHPGFYIGLGITSFAGALTHYFYVIVLVCVCTVYFIILLSRRKVRSALLYAFTEAAAALAAIAVFPTMISQIFNGANEYNTVSQYSYLYRIGTFLKIVNHGVFGGLMWVLLALIIITVVLYKRYHLIRKEYIGWLEKLFMLAIPCIVYVMTIAQSAPYLTDRYISTVYPLFLLIAVWMLYVTFKVVRRKQIVVAAFVIAAAVSITGMYSQQPITNLYTDRASINQLQEKREDRNALIFIADNCTWTIPSALSELKDYRLLLVMPYSEIPGGQLDELLNDEQAMNIYMYTWDVNADDLTRYQDQITLLLKKNNPEMRLEYLWDAPYSQVFQCVSD